MRTESQTRWEKGVDPHLAEHAIRYASQLLVELAGGRWVGGGEDAAELPEPPVVAFRPERTTQVTGLEFDGPVPGRPARAARLRGGHRPRRVRCRGRRSRRRRALDDGGVDDGREAVWDVTVPTWRARDVRREIDIVEEVARFRLEDVPTTLPVRQAMFGRLTHFQRLRRVVEDVLVGAGFYEAYTYSLQPSDPDPSAIELPVPLSSQQRFLRTHARAGPPGRGAAQRRHGEHGRPAVRGRARLPAHRARPRRCRASAGISAASSTARSRTRRARWRGSSTR